MAVAMTDEELYQLLAVPAFLMAWYFTRHIDTHTVKGVWEWVKAFTGYICTIAFVFVLCIKIVRWIYW